jgi:hypothetical protein
MEAAMRNLETTTKLDLAQAADKLKKFFGPEGEGLKMEAEADNCFTFSGGGGYVKADLCADEAGKTRINLITQEYEYQVDKFAAGLPK